MKRIVRACIDCREPVHFYTCPGDATCSACGLGMYLTEPDGLLGRYPGPSSFKPPLTTTPSGREPEGEGGRCGR